MITKHLENVTCIEDQSLSLVCELAEKDISVTWLKDEKVIEASKNIVPEIHNNAHILKFKKLSKHDGGKYALMARGKKTEAVVLVKGLFLHLNFSSSNLDDFNIIDLSIYVLVLPVL